MATGPVSTDGNFRSLLDSFLASVPGPGNSGADQGDSGSSRSHGEPPWLRSRLGGSRRPSRVLEISSVDEFHELITTDTLVRIIQLVRFPLTTDLHVVFWVAPVRLLSISMQPGAEHATHSSLCMKS